MQITSRKAERIADVVMAAAAIGAAFYIIKTPPLRKLAWQLAVLSATGAIPLWFRDEIRRAWQESAAIS